MKITLNAPDKYGEIHSNVVSIKLSDSPMSLSLNINGKEENWQLTYTGIWQGIGPKTGEAINGSIINLSHDWKLPKGDKFIHMNVIGTSDNQRNAKLIFWK